MFVGVISIVLLVVHNVQGERPPVFSFTAKTQSGGFTALGDGTFSFVAILIMCLHVAQYVEVYEGESSVKLHSFANTE